MSWALATCAPADGVSPLPKVSDADGRLKQAPVHRWKTRNLWKAGPRVWYRLDHPILTQAESHLPRDRPEHLEASGS